MIKRLWIATIGAMLCTVVGLSRAAELSNPPTQVGVGSGPHYAAVSVHVRREKIDRHAFEDWSTLPTTDTGLGYAGFDAKATMTNALDQNHFVGYQSRNIYGGSGNLTNYMHGYDTAMIHTGTGTISTVAGVWVQDVGGTGPITTNYGIYIGPVNRGSTAWALYSVGLNNYFGGIKTPIIQMTDTASAINFGGDQVGKSITYGYGTGGTANFGEHRFYNGKSGMVAKIDKDGLSVTGTITSTGYLRPPTYTWAYLPAGIEGALCYCSDCRKVSEGAGTGTGLIAVFTGGFWRRISDDAVVTN